MAIIIDRRQNPKGKSTENRVKFLKRIKEAIKDALPEMTRNRGLRDLDSSGGEVRVSRRLLDEPHFRHGGGGIKDIVAPGNKEYVAGDTIKKPPQQGGGGGGKQAGNDGSGEDDFVIEISREEFLEYFFEDLELPNMVKKDLMKVREYKPRHAGYVTDGSPNKLSVVKTYKQSLARRMAANGSRKRRLEELERLLRELVSKQANAITEAGDGVTNEHLEELANSIELTRAEIDKLKSCVSRFMDDTDLRFKNTIREPQPCSHAVMFLIQDISGSMGQREKLIARKFFYLMYAFLLRQYDSVDLVFIVHTNEAKEVDEQEFFNTRESGATVASTACKLMEEIIEERGYDNTNIYAAQVSDGDNYSSDNVVVTDVMRTLLPHVQYFAYAEIAEEGRSEEHYDSRNYLKTIYDSINSPVLATTRIFDESQIYDVFRSLFEKKSAVAA